MYYSLDVIGINKPEQGFIINQAVEDFFTVYLQDNDDVVTINVEVALDADINDTLGLADQIDDDEYTIYINKTILDNEIELYKTVVHELVHVKQYLTQQLEHINLFSSFWEGIEYNTLKVKYNDRPWEVEAYAIEEEFAACFENNRKLGTLAIKN